VGLDILKPATPARRGEWILLAILALAAAGAKATILPLLACGFVAVLVASVVRDRSLERRAASALAVIGGALLVGVTVVFRGTLGGLEIGLDSLRRFPIASSVGTPTEGSVSAFAVPTIVLLVSLVLWALMWSGAIGLLIDRRRLLGDGRLWFLLGIAGGGIAAASLLVYPGLSQWYYLRGAAGPFGLLVAWGIERMVLPGRTARVVLAFAAALAVGGLIGFVVQSAGPTTPPTVRRDGLVAVSASLLAPVAAILVALVVVSAVLKRTIVGRTGHAPVGLLIVAVTMGVGLPASVRTLAVPLLGTSPAGQAIPEDGIAAARWLRANSQPDDLVATNLHCLPGRTDNRCDARHFWIAAYAERRVLVEGWAYTDKAFKTAARLGVNDRLVPFWDEALLASNDAAFIAPSGGVSTLRDRAQVRWLLADLDAADERGLADAALLRFRQGRFAVYEVR
jgi:hypothetical protein